MKAKTLITGGRGFVGVNLAKALARTREVHVLDNLHRSSSTGWQNEPVRFHRADILEHASLRPLFDGITEVVHLAAYGSVIESVTDPAQNFAVNVQGALNVLSVAVAAGVRRFVFASTGGALIGDAIPPVDEDSLPKPLSPYGASKLCGEAYCHAFARSHGIETICMRFGNVYGPHSAHKTGAVTTFIKALMTDQPMVIYGDGAASRDYIHVDDLCTGIKTALDASPPDAEVFHLGSGRETPVIELAHILRDVANRLRHPIEFRDARRGEVTRNSASYRKGAPNARLRAHDLAGNGPSFDVLLAPRKQRGDFRRNHKRFVTSPTRAECRTGVAISAFTAPVTSLCTQCTRVD